MNSVACESPTLNLPRWLLLLSSIFLSQLLLIYFLSTRGSTVTQTASTVTPLQLFPGHLTESQFSEIFLASDPSLFASANRHGFSGAAWLKTSKRNYEQSVLAERTEPPFWLPLNLQQLGNGIGQFIQGNTIIPSSVSKGSKGVVPKIVITQVFDATNLKTNSQLRVEGDLVSREMIDPPQLRAWAHTELLSNSIVQVTVDRRGMVLSARLLSGSGFTQADNNSLELANNIQFVPSLNEVMLGKLIFDWHTVPVLVTDSTNEVLQPK